MTTALTGLKHNEFITVNPDDDLWHWADKLKAAAELSVVALTSERLRRLAQTVGLLLEDWETPRWAPAESRGEWGYVLTTSEDEVHYFGIRVAGEQTSDVRGLSGAGEMTALDRVESTLGLSTFWL